MQPNGIGSFACFGNKILSIKKMQIIFQNKISMAIGWLAIEMNILFYWHNMHLPQSSKAVPLILNHVWFGLTI